MINEEWLKDEDLTPCTNCGQKFINPIIHVIDINIGCVSPEAIRSRVGMATMFGGSSKAYEISRIMGTHPEGVVRLNTDPEGKTRLLICHHCYSGINSEGKPIKLLPLAELVERANSKVEVKNG